MRRMFAMFAAALLPAFVYGQWAQDNAADLLGEAYTRTLYPGMRLADAFGLPNGDTWTTNGLNVGAITLGGSKRTTWPVIGVYAETMDQGVATTNTPSWTNAFVGGWSVKTYLTRGDTAYGWGNHADVGYLTSIPVMHATNITATGDWATVQGAIDGLAAATDSAVQTNHTGNVSITGSITAGSYNPSITPYALTSAITTTVTAAMGNTLSLLVTNDISIFTITTSGYSTNDTHTMSLGLDNTANRLIVFDTNVIYGATSLTLANKVYTFTLHKGWRQDRFEILKGGYEK